MAGEEDLVEEAEAMYHVVVAEVLRELGYPDRAEESFMKAVSIDPWNPQIRARYGAFLVHTGRLEAGLRELRGVLDVEPGNAFARLNVALALEMYAMYAPAAQELEHCLRAEPDSSELLATYARLLRGAGEAGRAVACYRDAIARNGENQRARHELGTLLAEQGDDEAALDELLEAVLLDPQDLAAAFSYGQVLERIGVLGRAEARLRGLVASDPGNATARHRYGVILERLGRLDEAEEQYAAAVKLGDEGACLALAALLHRLNGPREPSRELYDLLGGRKTPGEVEEIASRAGEPEAMQQAYFYYIEP
jgi:Tfp pilus assembly protein PilF